MPAFSLPPELLCSIFQFVLPPYIITLDSSLCHGSNSTWSQVRRMKTSIVLVCRAWHSSGVAFLYKDVHLRRFPELLAFLRTLKESSILGGLVKSLHISFLLPQGVEEKYGQLMQAVFTLCPSLLELDSSNEQILYRWDIQACPIPSTITHLRLECIISYYTTLQILRGLGDTLLSLRLRFCDDWPLGNEPIKSLTRDWDVSLARLQSLFLYKDGVQWIRPLRGSDQALRLDWNMPNLNNLSFLPYHSRMMSSEVSPVLSSCGQQLLFLHLSFSDTTAVDAALKLCPRLERMVIPYYLARGRDWGVAKPCHNALKWVDVLSPSAQFHTWDNFPDAVTSIITTEWATRKQFPSFIGLRNLWNLPEHMYPDIERFDPTWVQEQNDRFTIEIFDSQLRHEIGHLCWNLALEQQRGLSPPLLRANTPDTRYANWGSDSDNDRADADPESELGSLIMDADWDSNSDSEWADTDSESEASSEESGGSVTDLAEEDRDVDLPLVFEHVEYIVSLL